MQLRPHQIKFGKQLHEVLSKYNISYLAGQVRSGKSGTALYCAELYNAEQVLFVSKKSALSSVQKDYKAFGFAYELTTINYASLHKVEKIKYDLVIYDEAHSLGAFAKPSKRTKLAKQLFYSVPTILMSGTPSAESYSQLYHQFYVSKYSPFNQYTNFYKWAKDYVDKKELRLPTHTVTDYSNAKVDKIDEVIKPYIVRMSQSDAGFTTEINETKLYVEVPELIKRLTSKLLNDRVIEGKGGFIFGDAPAKLQSKVHQLFNGHCIIEKVTGETFTKVFSNYKVDYIKERFKGQKIAIMYYYQAEREMLENAFDLAKNIDEFNNTDKNIAIQQSATEGMNVSKADALVYLNLGFSGKNYLQSRDRMTVKERKTNDVYFICERNGITEKILKAVRNKKDFNSRLFKKEFNV